MGEFAELLVGDGPARQYLALPPGGRGPGVLVLHAWWGLTDVFTSVCDRLTAAGYVACAPDLYDGPTATTIPDAERLMEASDNARSQAIVLAAADFLRRHPAVTAGPMGVVGYSMGAAWALLLSTMRPSDIAAAVTFYGTYGGIDFSQARAAYLGHCAEHDPYEALETVRTLEEEIRSAGRDVTFHIYPGTGHWFCEDNRPDAYDADAARLAWERTMDFLNRHLNLQ